jgi:hypothetical protein
MTARDSTGRAAELVDEITLLVRTAARRPDVTVSAGRPGCNWSFNWKTGIVTIDPVHLKSLAPDLCRGLALHEATHAAVTRLHRLLAPKRLHALMPLLNPIEDIRIELWMRTRFPGASPWIRAYNDALYGLLRDAPLPRSRRVQFLRGMLERWWYGSAAEATLPEVAKALTGCWTAIAAATDCQPPHGEDEPAILETQRAMWRIVKTRILPAWERLGEQDREDGIGALAETELDQFLDMTGGDRAAGVDGSERSAPNPADGRDGEGSPSADAPRDAIAASLGTDGSDAYLAAWKRIAGLCDRLGDTLLRTLLPRRRLRWTGRHPSGSRLDLRRAMRLECDADELGRLWQRPVQPDRRDPAVGLLIDTSGSMAQEDRIARAFEALVLLIEVCGRIGLPTAVWTFARQARAQTDWLDTPDETMRRRLARIPGSCGGGTRLAPALDTVAGGFGSRRADPKILFVLSDGLSDEKERLPAAIAHLEAEGVAVIGLGIGDGTDEMAVIFRTAVTGIPPRQLVDHMGRLLTDALGVIP